MLLRLFDDSLLDQGHLNSKNSRFSLWRLVHIKDDTLVERLLGRLDDLAPVASVLAEYLRPHIERPDVVAGLSAYFGDHSRVGHDYLMYHLFALALEYPRAMPAAWLAAADEAMRDRQAPAWLRGVAANVVARGRKLADIGWIRNQAQASTDDFYTRYLLVALARADYLDPVTVRT